MVRAYFVRVEHYALRRLRLYCVRITSEAIGLRLRCIRVSYSRASSISWGVSWGFGLMFVMTNLIVCTPELATENHANMQRTLRQQEGPRGCRGKSDRSA